MKKYYATVEQIRNIGIEFKAEDDSAAIKAVQKYADTLSDEDFKDGGSAIDWGLVDTGTNRTVVPLGDVL